MSKEDAMYSFRVCFEPDGGVYCNKILETDETIEMTEKEAISNAGEGTTVEVVNAYLDTCQSEILESLLVLNRYMDDYDLEYLFCKFIEAGFKAGAKYGAQNLAVLKKKL